MRELKAFDVGLGQYSEDGSPCVVAFDADRNPRLLNEKVYFKSEVDAAIAELKQKLEDAKATAYAESVDAGMRERRLKRALYKACANWANVEVFDRTVGIDDPNVEANRWALMRNKCLKKVEEYK